MVTSPTSEKITKTEVKVSGSCQFIATLPAVEGQYDFYVSVSPGGGTFTASKNWFSVEKPTSPTVSCRPHPYVLQNTEVTYDCNTASLGQPAGYLRWVIGHQTNQRKGIREDQQILKPRALHHIQTLTLSDHRVTWFRCDVIWGTEEILGGNNTANVGYPARKPLLFLNGREGDQTVGEGDRAQFKCESDGRPTSRVDILNHDNDSVTWRDSSPAIHAFVAKCEDTATYTCSARNQYSSRSDDATSLALTLGVRCEPRMISITHSGNVKFRNKTKYVSFDVVAFPVPHEYGVWFAAPAVNHSKPAEEKIETSQVKITCKVDQWRRYLARCTLTIYSIPSFPGLYKIQLINDVGDENFTVVINYGYDSLDWTGIRHLREGSTMFYPRPLIAL